MIKLQTTKGAISISDAVFTNITGNAATNCIIVEHGINITAACRSIMSEVQYKVSKYTGIPVKSVDVCVDSVVSNSKGV